MTVGHNGINAVHNNRAAWIDGDRLVADARRAVHEALVALPAPEADRARSLIADLETAIEARTAMRLPVVPVSSPPPDQTALVDAGAAAIWALYPDVEPSRTGLVLANPHAVAAAVLAVLPPPADRTAVLTEAERTMLTYALDQAQEHIWSRDGFTDEDQAAVTSLRRLAAEAQQEAPGPGADLIEDYLRFLRGQGPEPDLSHLTPDQRKAVTGQFEIVRALADRDPELPPLDRDPVARRLGLHATAEAQQPEPEAQPESCAQCGKPIRRITGTLTEWWVHVQGGRAFCYAWQPACSPRATPKPTVEAQQPDTAHSCSNCDGIDPDTCFMNPDRPPEQCPRSEFDGYGLQCQKPAGHNLCTFEEQPPPVHKGGNADDCPACQTDGLDTIGPPYECPGDETGAGEEVSRG